jgi:hypothetical protein
MKNEPCWKCGARAVDPFRIILNCRRIKDCAYLKLKDRLELAKLRPEYKVV